MNGIAVVIAAYNEADNIADVVRKAAEHAEVIVVDDASTDDTGALARQAGATIVRHEVKTHIKQAFIDGFRHALRSGPKYIVQMDAGLSHDPDEIPTLVNALREADVVIGSRCVDGGRLIKQPLRRRALSWGGSLLVRMATGMKIKDLTSGFKAYRRSVLQVLDARGFLDRLEARTFAFQFELSSRIHRLGYRIKEVPITYRATGSSLNLSVVWEALCIWMRLLWERHIAWRKWVPTDAIRRVQKPLTTHLRRRRLKHAARVQPCRIVVGAAGNAPPAWTPTEVDLLDLLAPDAWASFFRTGSLDAILAEHVWEHLTEEEGRRAARVCFEYLRPGGTLRVAVPDGLHPDPGYHSYVRPGGSGSGADDHKVLYTYRSLREVFESAGFEVALLEYFDERGEFHLTDWPSKTGMIRRSWRFDPRNRDGQLNYTSIVIDAVKPISPDHSRDVELVSQTERRSADIA